MTDEPMKIPVQYADEAETLKRVLKLTGSPVAMKFAATKEDIPAGIEEIDKIIRHCSMVNLARREGRIFFAQGDKHECNGGHGHWACARSPTPLKMESSTSGSENSTVPRPARGQSSASLTCRPTKPMPRCMPPLRRHHLIPYHRDRGKSVEHAEACTGLPLPGRRTGPS